MTESRVIYDKIGYKAGQVTISHRKPDLKDKVPFTSKGSPLPEFFERLSAFKIVVSALPIDPKGYDDFVVKSVSLIESNGSYDEIVVTGTFTREDKQSWNVNTPLLQVGDFPGLNEEIDKLILEAERYLAGERSQMALDLDAEDSEGTDSEDGDEEKFEKVLSGQDEEDQPF